MEGFWLGYSYRGFFLGSRNGGRERERARERERREREGGRVREKHTPFSPVIKKVKIVQVISVPHLNYYLPHEVKYILYIN